MKKSDVHTRHCHYYGCKYGEEDTCTVYLGYADPEYENKFSNKPTEKEFQRRREEAEEMLNVF